MAPTGSASSAGWTKQSRRSVSMPEIILTTLTAKYIHTAFGLRYLMANLGASAEAGANR